MSLTRQNATKRSKERAERNQQDRKSLYVIKTQQSENFTGFLVLYLFYRLFRVIYSASAIWHMRKMPYKSMIHTHNPTTRSNNSG